MAGLIEGGTERNSSVGNSLGTTSKRRILSSEAQNKLIYDLLAADNGLASILSGQNMVGASNSSSQTLMAQDFMTKALGELALVTAEEVGTTTGESKKVDKKSGIKGKIPTVICTELYDQGKLSAELYTAGHDHFLSLHPNTVAGYQIWARKVVKLMQKSERLSNWLLPIVVSRYLMTTGLLPVTFWGLATIYIGQPICFVIGSCLPKEVSNGNESYT